uniref:Uncharacterized protein n=1 Tax=Guillardia theta TaxID=55529 RepID=A0A7S4P0M3_GUITH|mmetsp:Transcript_40657/g.128192  ORF Transcript_40657/g.128192 Transcript_40657/m.128192 type:complete len:455 (+) Transcript_40657:40-1404(+)
MVRLPWVFGSLAVALMMVMVMVTMEDGSTVLSQKKQEKNNKYTEELSSLARSAEPGRKHALAQLDRLQKRSGFDSVRDARSKHKVPRALQEMESLAKRKSGYSSDSGSGAAALGKLERSHGIQSSKKMLAEIMSFRHYKQSNNEINELANGFESHSSLSHRLRSSINMRKARMARAHLSEKKRHEASALRLEAGRLSRRRMLRSTAERASRKIGAALTQTFKPIQSMLHRDEITLDDMLSKRKLKQVQDSIVSSAADSVNSALKQAMKKEVERVVRKKELEMKHKSKEYLTEVHKKAKAALSSVTDLDPDSISTKLEKKTSQKQSSSQPWSAKVESFLQSTDQFIHSIAADGAWALGTTGNELNKGKVQKDAAAGKKSSKSVSEDDVIEATKSHLEQELRSARAIANHGKLPTGSRGRKQDRIGQAAGSLSNTAKKHMSKQDKDAFRRALNSYL